MYHFELTNELDPFFQEEDLQYVGGFNDFRNDNFQNLIGKRASTFEIHHPKPVPIRFKNIQSFKIIKIQSLFKETLASIIVFDFLDEVSSFYDYSKYKNLIMDLKTENRLVVYHKNKHGLELLDNPLLNTELINFFKEQNIIRS